MAVKTERKPRAKKPKQGFLKDMDPPSIKVVDDAAEIYHDVKTQRVKLSKEEDEAKDNLIDKMKENGLTIYETSDGLIVTLTATSNVKTKKKTEGGVEGEFTEDQE